MIRLGCTPINKHLFSLFVLGFSNLDNSRTVHLDTGVYVCSSLKIFLVDNNDERFDFKYTRKGTGFFTSSKNGKYALELTSDMTLKETSEETPYFIEVFSRGSYQKAKVVLLDGQSTRGPVSPSNALVEI
jgi:hypothetical protein